MSMFWWMVKHEQWKYYKNRNREYQKKQQEKRRLEKERNKGAKKVIENFDRTSKLIDDIHELNHIFQYAYYPCYIGKDDKITASRYPLHELKRKAYNLRAEANICDLKNNHRMGCANAQITLDLMIESIEEKIAKQSKQEIKKDKIPNLSNPKLYNKLMTNIKNKKFKNEKEKMKMIKIVGESGLSVEERKQLISMIK